MEFKVREVESTPIKGVRETEEELLKKHEEQLETPPPGDTPLEVPPAEVPTAEEDDLPEEKVLSFINKRYNKSFNSFDDVLSERQAEVELPEDVSKYLQFRKETGRGYDDFIKLNEDFDSMDADEVLRRHFTATQPGLDSEDIDVLMEEFSFDDSIDDDSKIKRVKIEKKKAVAEARKFLNEQKEKYKAPVASIGANIPDANEREEYDAYKRYVESAKTVEEQNRKKREWFDQKTNELLNEEFKGFEFKVGNKSVKYTTGDATEIKKSHSSPMNFISKFLDENGMMKDAAGYHKSLAVAMNPERFAEFFYEQGKADALQSSMKGIKNVQMGEQKIPQATVKGGVQVKAVNPDSGRSLKIRSIKKVN